MADRDVLLAAAMEDPEYLARQRRLARLQFADAIEEAEGPGAPASVGLRWTAEWDRMPRREVRAAGPVWRWLYPGIDASQAGHRLPEELYDLLPGAVPGTLGMPFPSPLEAIEALGRAILQERGEP